jgi:transposase
VALVVEEIHGLDHHIVLIDQQFGQVAATHPVAQRLQQILGVGVLTATALVGAVNHIHAFRRDREFASWLGLTPRESSTGGRRYLGRISKQGDVYLRCLLTHGARAVLLSAQRTSRTSPQRLTRLQAWAVTTAARRGLTATTVTHNVGTDRGLTTESRRRRGLALRLSRHDHWDTDDPPSN